jgi:hypothetical protein
MPKGRKPRYSRVAVDKVSASEVPGDFYFVWRAELYLAGSKTIIDMHLKKLNKKYSDAKTAHNAGAKRCKQFGYIVLTERPWIN